MKKGIICIVAAIMVCSLLLPAFSVSAYDMSRAGKTRTLSAGNSNAAAIKKGIVYAWGNSTYGEAGYTGGGNFLSSDLRSARTPRMVITESVYAAIGAGYTTSIKSDGSVWTIGDNRYGQLGNGSYNTELSKVFDDAVMISAGMYHMMAIKSDGSLWAWGRNNKYQLGDGTNETHLKPVKIMDGVAAVSAGGEHTAVIKTDGSLWTWGGNEKGQLGDGTYTDRETPVKVMDNAAAVLASGANTAAVKDDGSLWIWGENSFLKIGDETVSANNTPVKVMDDVDEVAIGASHAVILKNDGTVWTLGKNSNGELGNGTKESVTEPVQIMEGAVSVAAGNGFSAAMKSNGTVWTWGSNNYGQLGDGATKNLSSPTNIFKDAELPTVYVSPEPTVSPTASPTSSPEAEKELNKDTVVSGWADAEVREAFDNGLIPDVLDGADLTKPINRAEFAAAAVKLYEKLSGNTAVEADNPFGDISSDACKSEILKAYNLNIVTGVSETLFEPSALITREQAAAMLCRAYKSAAFEGWSVADDDNFPLEYNASAKFADDAEISDYAKEAVYFMAERGIIAGVGDNLFAPKGKESADTMYGLATREQAILMTLRCFKNL